MEKMKLKLNTLGLFGIDMNFFNFAIRKKYLKYTILFTYIVSINNFLTTFMNLKVIFQAVVAVVATIAEAKAKPTSTNTKSSKLAPLPLELNKINNTNQFINTGSKNSNIPQIFADNQTISIEEAMQRMCTKIIQEKRLKTKFNDIWINQASKYIENILTKFREENKNKTLETKDIRKEIENKILQNHQLTSFLTLISDGNLGGVFSKPCKHDLKNCIFIGYTTSSEPIAIVKINLKTQKLIEMRNVRIDDEVETGFMYQDKHLEGNDLQFEKIDKSDFIQDANVKAIITNNNNNYKKNNEKFIKEFISSMISNKSSNPAIRNFSYQSKYSGIPDLDLLQNIGSEVNIDWDYAYDENKLNLENSENIPNASFIGILSALGGIALGSSVGAGAVLAYNKNAKLSEKRLALCEWIENEGSTIAGEICKEINKRIIEKTENNSETAKLNANPIQDNTDSEATLMNLMNKLTKEEADKVGKQCTRITQPAEAVKEIAKILTQVCIREVANERSPIVRI
jgi:hypothetical protein